MFQAQIKKRLSERNSQRLFGVVTLSPAVILLVDADGKSVLSETTINQTLVSTVCNKFPCGILSLIVRDFSAYFTIGLCVNYTTIYKVKQIRIDGYLEKK